MGLVNFAGKKCFSGTHTHATAAKIEQATPSAGRIFITDIAGSSDKAGSILLVKAGGTTIFQIQVGAAFFAHRFEVPLICDASKNATVEIDGTSACKANIVGFVA